jgi:uncharacterized protein DUF3179
VRAGAEKGLKRPSGDGILGALRREEEGMEGSRVRGRRLQGTWTAATLLVIGALVWVLTPVVLIHPFRPQTAFGVALAYELRRQAAAVTLGAFLLLLPVLVYLAWPFRRGWRWAPLIALLLTAGVSAWFARQNHFEWMFNPLWRATYAPATLVDFVDDKDMVVAIEIAGEAVAYPVRQMAYHHVVMDTVGGVPVVGTY